MNLNLIYGRVARWNAARYEQECNHDLAMALLREEYHEFVDAENKVDTLDALCDLVYVALGVIWKSKVADVVMSADIDQAYGDTVKLVETNTIMPGYLVGAVIDMCDADSDYPVSLAMHMIIQLSLSQMTTLVHTDDAMTALSIVCDSNDTKAVPSAKVDSAKKANVDKGLTFIAPEPRLQVLIDDYEAYHGHS